MPTLPINDVVEVKIQISPSGAVRAGFNLGLIVGKSTVITSVNRVAVYSGLPEMLAAGFTESMPEYLAAVVYFSQFPKPTRVAIGRWDGTGTETAVQAVTACRLKNTDWYACYVCNATSAEIVAIAAYIETATPSSVQFYTTADADVLAGTAGNVMLLLKAASYGRTIGQYSTTPYAAVAIMGYAMGANTGLINSSFALAYKREVGVIAEAVTAAQVTTLKAQNGNVYVKRGNTYDLFEQGVMANGVRFDEVLGLDMLSNGIQIAVMNLLSAVNIVPQTEGGVALIVLSINGPCQDAKNQGFISPGVWNASPILSLNTGDTLTQGYLILSETIGGQNPVDRAARKSPPIYVCIKLAGAIEFVSIQVNVDR